MFESIRKKIKKSKEKREFQKGIKDIALEKKESARRREYEKAVFQEAKKAGKRQAQSEAKQMFMTKKKPSLGLVFASHGQKAKSRGKSSMPKYKTPSLDELVFGKKPSSVKPKVKSKAKLKKLSPVVITVGGSRFSIRPQEKKIKPRKKAIKKKKNNFDDMIWRL